MLAVGATAVILGRGLLSPRLAQLLPERRRLLLALRTAAILLVVLLLFRPVLVSSVMWCDRRSVILALDASASMSTADDATGAARFDQARNRVVDWSTRLKKDFDVHIVTFGEQAVAAERPGDLLQLKPRRAGDLAHPGAGHHGAGGSPPRGRGGRAVFGRHSQRGRRPHRHGQAGGRGRHGRRGRQSAEQPLAPRRRGSRTFECPEQLPVNDRARITASVGQSGLAGQVVKAIFEEDGKPLDQSEIVLREGDTLQEVVFQFVPTVKGRHTYTVRIPPVTEEKIAQNNHRSVVVQVVDSKIRVLYLEGTLRASTGRSCNGSCPRTPTSSSARWCRPAPTSSSSGRTWKASSWAGCPAMRRPSRNSTSCCWATSTAPTGSRNRWIS